MMSLIQGMVVGLVTKVDEQIPGRVKVHFTAFEETHETDWIRIATAMAGNGRGTFFMPQVNDEVLVAFERGDVRFPFVVGFLWNGQDKPPADHVRLRRIQSVNGHSISFIDATEDHGSKGALVIEDAHGNRITMSNSKMTISCVGVLEIQGAVVTINGRIVSPTANPI
jgi:phage baseplate assembly protein V